MSIGRMPETAAFEDPEGLTTDGSPLKEAPVTAVQALSLEEGAVWGEGQLQVPTRCPSDAPGETTRPTMTTKQIVSLNGSPRKRRSNTGELLREIEALIPPDLAHVTRLDLADYEVAHCLGCERCILKDIPCFQDDDAGRVLQQIREADGLILSSPVYMLNVTGKLKSLIDRSASWFHRPTLVGRPALVASSTAGSGLKETLDYLEKVVIQWGGHPAGRIGRSLTDAEPVGRSELSRFLWHLRNEPSRYRPSLRQLIFYHVQKVVAMKTSPVDRAYWEAQGWDEAVYYHPCRISLVKQAFARAFYWMLERRVEPVERSVDKRD